LLGHAILKPRGLHFYVISFKGQRLVGFRGKLYLGGVSMINKKIYRKFDFWMCVLLFVVYIRTAIHIDLASWDWRIDTIVVVLSVIGILIDLFHQDKE